MQSADALSRVALLAAAFLAFPTVATSCGQVPNHRPSAIDQAEANEQRGTKEALGGGKVKPDADAKPRSGEDRGHEQREESYQFENLVITGAVGLIALGTCIIVGWQAWETRKAAKATLASATIAERSLAISQRGYLQIRLTSSASGELSTLLRYRLIVEGPTPIYVIAGSYMRLSIDDPPFPDSVTQNERTFRIAPTRVSHRTRDDDRDAMFPALTLEQKQRWSQGMLLVYVSGTVRYRDAFASTPVHRKYFGYEARIGGPWAENQFARNDEEDEAEGEIGEYHRN